jgi:protease-4
VVDGLRAATTDRDVRGLMIRVGGHSPGFAVVHALRNAITRFAASGRPTVCFAESFGELSQSMSGYLLASACDTIFLQPSGSVGLGGVSASAVFLRGALDRLGVQPEIDRRHEYKSAADMFVSPDMTAPNREMLTQVVSSLAEHTLAAVAASRDLDPAAVTAAVTESPVPAMRALELGLVDRLGYVDDAYADVRDRAGCTATRYVERHHRHGSIPRRRPGRTVAVVPITGAIVAGSGAPGRARNAATSASVTAALRAAGSDKAAAVVLRVNSPGGSYVASDAIRHKVLRLRADGIPVVAAMGSVAASGGYFVSMGADEIVAAPGSLTGSIGVLGGKGVVRDLLARGGIVARTLGSHPHADMMSPLRGFADEEWAKLQAFLDSVYDDFTTKAAEDRGMDVAQLELHARGRVWTGVDAVKLGLVDRLGDLSDAVRLAARLADVDADHVRIKGYPHQSWLTKVRPAENSELSATAILLPTVPADLLSVVTSALGVLPAGILQLPGQWRLS